MLKPEGSCYTKVGCRVFSSNFISNEEGGDFYGHIWYCWEIRIVRRTGEHERVYFVHSAQYIFFKSPAGRSHFDLFFENIWRCFTFSSLKCKMKARSLWWCKELPASPSVQGRAFANSNPKTVVAIKCSGSLCCNPAVSVDWEKLLPQQSYRCTRKLWRAS